jgi:hypothetical protein
MRHQTDNPTDSIRLRTISSGTPKTSLKRHSHARVIGVVHQKRRMGWPICLSVELVGWCSRVTPCLWSRCLRVAEVWTVFPGVGLMKPSELQC